jgi:hypothetical protein
MGWTTLEIADGGNSRSVISAFRREDQKPVLSARQDLRMIQKTLEDDSKNALGPFQLERWGLASQHKL